MATTTTPIDINVDTPATTEDDRPLKKPRTEDDDVLMTTAAPIDTTTPTSPTTSTPTSTTSTVTPTSTPTSTTKPFDSVAINTGRVNMMMFNLPKNMDTGRFQKLLTKNGTTYVKAKKVFKEQFAVVTLESVDLVQPFIEKWNGFDLDGVKLKAQEKTGRQDNDNNNNNNNNNRNKRGRDDSSSGGGADAPLRLIEDIVNPWHNIEYSVQLEKKRAGVLDVLTNMTTAIRKECTKQPDWLLEKKGRQLACPLEEIIASPVVSNYRNKCSYTIGRKEDQTPCIGFALGRTGNGITVVGDPSNCQIISGRSNAVRRHLETYVLAHARPPFDKMTHTGFWRQLTVRDFTTGETMATVQFNHRGLTEQEIKDESAALIAHFDKAKGTDAEVTSLSIQCYDGVSNAAPVDLPVLLIAGTETVAEQLLGLKFNVSSNAFFQVNTKAAELLFSRVVDWAGVSARNIVLDVCCGTGTIGQCLSKQARHVYGLEMAPDAVEDAKVNAKCNGITNVDYIVGKAEDTMDGLLATIGRTYNDVKEGEIIGIVDPPRAGLHPSVIKCLRQFESMKRLVYVSCNQNSLIQDAAKLCKSITNTMRGTPFKPVKALAVDLFPHTELVEVVVLFERIDLHRAPAVVVAPVVVAPVAVAVDVASTVTDAPVVAPATSNETSTTTTTTTLES
ncbi:hypothetical protein SAMD00019534_008890 [Acytostelium subglobosum LB1]|uniref:hypothetical protein n=1 Tax=Acytostelium subglobosum LB1 TaxID=1410327 RepID=UPI000644F63A|nr:hypothetical protein SAMD00019534_008890 [Acytostelium subglobosum LB1]GAM17714.1 hypothetical protein SAMD00019534_008890 [Acytostelium subglobosum LB1]|eukprot:XP_012758310.1 hypothetical protein SAMD00019534_008890 [Acytostelium subglobosum LB1]